MNLVQELQKAGHQINQNDFGYWEVKNPEGFLNNLILNSFVLHGSTRQLEELNPQQANDANKESGNRKAIYMTSTPPVAMFAALVGGIPLGESRHSVNMDIDDGKITFMYLSFAVQNQHMIADHGYVYVFGPDQYDEHIEGEYLSYKPQKPLAVIGIKRSDFKYPIEEIPA